MFDLLRLAAFVVVLIAVLLERPCYSPAIRTTCGGELEPQGLPI